MPKNGRDRRSARDEARGQDQGGGLGSDEDYDWIRYLGEGRAPSGSSAAAPSAVPSAARPAAQPTARPAIQPAARPAIQPSARPATLPARSRQDATPVRNRRPGRAAARTDSPARPGPAAPPSGEYADWPPTPSVGYAADWPGTPPAGYAADRPGTPSAGYAAGRPGYADRGPQPEADQAPLNRDDRRSRSSRPSRPRRPTGGRAVRLTAGRPVDLASGRETDLLFNPAADDYGQPLYPEQGSRPARQQARPDLDWPEPDPDRPYPDRPYPDRPAADRPYPDRPYPDRPYPDGPAADGPAADRPAADGPAADRSVTGRAARKRAARSRPGARLDTAEYAKPLYPPPAANQAASPVAPARSRRPEPDELADTDARRRVPDDHRLAGRQARPDQTGPLPRRGRQARTGPQRRVDTLDGGDRAARTGPQRRVDAPGGGDLAADTGQGARVAGLAGAAAGPGLARGDAGAAAAAIAGVAAQQNGVGQRGGQAAAGGSPEIGLLDRQLRYRGRPPRKPGRPRKPGKPSRPGKVGGQQSGKQARSGRGRLRAGRKVSGKVLAVGAAVAVVVLAAAGYLVLRPQTPHAISAPATLGSYTRQQENATAVELKHRIVTAARGDVKNVVAAVYEQKAGPGTSAGPQVVAFIGGNLTGVASASDLISAYMARLHGAFTTSAGKLGGQAACAPGSQGGPAECAWADNDTFGVVVSATLNSTALADEMRLMRPQLEHVVK